ncbi:mannose-1-phosphate guanylyltransferase [Candidatus Fermentibacteria bacterium]|nr:mannose-1-phosphate guanylyltransferase [Candidatus Fermentibacteria bacterium]
MFHGVILAGGRGERLWPMNTRSHPKHLLTDVHGESMLEKAIRRIHALVPPKHVLVVTHRSYLDAIQEHLEGRIKIGGYVVEPEGRNTAVAIALAAMKLLKADPNAHMFVLPADHFIGEEDRLRQALRTAARLTLEGEKLVTIGVNPTRPETNYGYIEMGRPLEGDYEVPAFSVKAFKEKPDPDDAVDFLARGDFLWNTGMYVWKARVLLDSVKRFMPELNGGLAAIDPDLGTDGEDQALEGLYTRIGNVSIDYGVMEKADNVLVVRGGFVWDDYSDWEIVARVEQEDEDGNVLRGKVVALESQRSLVWSADGVVAALGVEDLVIVRKGNAVLVCPRTKAREVKSVVHELRSGALDEYA